MSLYLGLKLLHVTCVALSGGGFLLRVWWAWRRSPIARARWVRVVPHVVDSLLLGSALSMVWWSAQYPFVLNWLTAKVFALLLYIVAGSYALRRGRTATGRVISLGVAVLAFSYIVAVALTRSPLLWLSAL